MTLADQWEHYFKPEARSSGRSLVNRGVVQLIQPSDTEIQAYIRVSGMMKVFFRAASVESPIVNVSCSCPNGKKGQFCKHIYATLLQIEETKPDFLDGKADIEMSDAPATLASGQPNVVRELSATQVEQQQKQKERQNDYRKEQYQIQKARLKEQKTGRSERPSKFAPPAKPDFITEALTYFSNNGIPLDEPLSALQVQHAKKILSRVFHPDKGGTHQEILELNQNCETLLEYINAT